MCSEGSPTGPSAQITVSMERNEELADKNETSPASRKEAEKGVARIKAQLEALAGEEQDKQRREIEAQDQLRPTKCAHHTCLISRCSPA
jgi:hypothetical protein